MEKLHELRFGNDFMDITPKAQKQKQNRNTGVHQTQKLVHIKGNNQLSIKATYEVKENFGK